MMHDLLQQATNSAMAMGPTVLLQGIQLRRPIDLVRARALSVDDKRSVVAAWASDFYAVDSKPALRQLPGITPLSIDEVQLRSKSSIGATVFIDLRVQASCFIDLASRLIACSSERCPSQ